METKFGSIIKIKVLKYTWTAQTIQQSISRRLACVAGVSARVRRDSQFDWKCLLRRLSGDESKPYVNNAFRTKLPIVLLSACSHVLLTMKLTENQQMPFVDATIYRVTRVTLSVSIGAFFQGIIFYLSLDKLVLST